MKFRLRLSLRLRVEVKAEVKVEVELLHATSNDLESNGLLELVN